MNSELEAIKAAHDKAATLTETGGPNPHVENEDGVLEGDHFNDEAHDEVRTLSKAYVAAHPEQFTSEALGGINLDDIEACVTAVEVFRNAGMPELEWKFEAWLLYHFPPQNIGGTYSATINLHTIGQ